MSAEIVGLAVAFFAAALVYASVGFGGGSAYLALLTLVGVPLAGIPLAHVAVIALVCNVVVVTGGSWHFVRAGHFRAELLLPFLMASVPAAYLGGRQVLDVEVLRMLTGLALAAAAAPMLVQSRGSDTSAVTTVPRLRLWGVGASLGGLLGGLSGLIGIGGGIFLAPVLHLLGWGTAKQIAAAASLFILINSLAGLAGKAGTLSDPRALVTYAPLVLAVLVGGQVGSRLGARRWPPLVVKRVTAAVVMVAAVNLLVGS